MKALVLRGAVASAVVAPVMVLSAGFASAATGLASSATAIPFVGMTIVQVSGATPGAACGAANQPITAPTTDNLARLVVAPLQAIPNGTRADASGKATIMLATGDAGKIYTACIKPTAFPPAVNFQTAEASVGSPFGS